VLSAAQVASDSRERVCLSFMLVPLEKIEKRADCRGNA